MIMARKKPTAPGQEKRIHASALFATPLTPAQRHELEQLAALPDSQIDYSDAPERLPAEVEPRKANLTELMDIARRISQAVKRPCAEHGDVLYDEHGLPK